MKRFIAVLAFLLLMPSAYPDGAYYNGGTYGLKYINNYLAGYYLKLDCSNDPLTGDLDLGTHNLTTTGTGTFGSATDVPQLTIKANATQSNTNPLVLLEDSIGTDLMWIHSNTLSNIFMGVGAGQAITTGIANVFIGSNAGLSNTTGFENFALGQDALQANVDGNTNIAIGKESLAFNVSGSGNLVIGSESAGSLTTGSSNILIGSAIDTPAADTSNYLNIGNLITGDTSAMTVDIAGTLGAGAITGTSFIIGANTLTTTEWAFLDGQDQAVKVASSPQFAEVKINTATAMQTLTVSGDATLSDANPNIVFRDSTDNTAYCFHLESGVGAAPYQNFQLWRGTDTGGSNSFAVNPDVPLMWFDNTNNAHFSGNITANGVLLGAGGATPTLDQVLTAGSTTTQVPTFGAVNIVRADPYYRLSPAVGDAFENYAFDNEWYFTNYTDGTVLWKVNTNNLINFYNQAGFNFPNGAPADNQILKYDVALGRLAWEADAGGGGFSVYVEEGDAAKVNNTGADLYVDFGDGFDVGVVGNEGNVTLDFSEVAVAFAAAETDPKVDTEAEIEAITGALFGASKVVTAGYVWVADGTDFESCQMTGDVSIASGGATTIADSVTVTGWVMGASTATTPAADDADTSLATTAFCETTQDYLKTTEYTTLGDLVTTAPITGAANNIFPGADGTKATIAITVLKNIVAGVGLSGGENDVLPGADADVTLTFAPAEVTGGTTWDDGGEATVVWTWSLSGANDPTLTFGNSALTLAGVLTADGLTLGADENITLGAKTIDYETATSDFNFNDDINISDTDPHIQLIPTVGDAFELYAFGNQVFLANVTDSTVIFRSDGVGLTIEGTGNSTFGSDVNPQVDNTLDLGIQNTGRWANVWATLVNGADYSFENGWRLLESEKYEGYPEGIAIGYEGFKDGVVTDKMPAGIKPLFVVTENFIEYKGRRVSFEWLDSKMRQLEKLDKLLEIIK